MPIRKITISNNKANKLSASTADFLDEDTEERGLSNWDFNEDGNMSAVDVQHFQISISLYEEYEERTKVAAKTIVPFYFGDLDGDGGTYKTLGDIISKNKKEHIDLLPDSLKIEGIYYHKDMILPIANAYSPIKKTNGDTFTFAGLYNTDKQQIINFLNEVEATKRAAIDYAETELYTSNNRKIPSRTISKTISENYNDSPIRNYKLVLRGRASDRNFKKGISKNKSSLKIDENEYRKVIEVLAQMVVKVSSTDEVVDVKFLDNPDKEFFFFFLVGYANYATDQSLEVNQEQNIVDPNIINDKIQALFSVLSSTKIQNKPVFSIEKEYRENTDGSVPELYKENVLLKTSDFTEGPDNLKKIKALNKVKTFTKSLFNNSEIKDSLIIYDINSLKVLPEPYKNASYVNDGGVIHSAYSVDKNKLAQRFFGFQDSAYFLHNIEAIHLPKIRQRIIDIIKYAIENGTLPANSKIKSVATIDFRSKEIADLTSAIATKHSDYVMSTYKIDPNSNEGEKIKKSVEETTSLFDAPERLYSDISVIEPPIWKIVQCQTQKVNYVYENPYYDYSISGLFHAANIDDTKGVAAPAYEDLFLKNISGVYYLYNNEQDDLASTYQDFQKQDSSIFHLSWNSISGTMSTFFYDQERDINKYIEPLKCYTVTRDIKPKDKSLILPYSFLPNYWIKADNGCNNIICKDPSPSPSMTPSVTITPTVTPSISVSRSPAISSSPTPTVTKSPSHTASITPPPDRAPSPTKPVRPTRTVTQTPTPSVTKTPSLTPTNTVTPSTSLSPTPTKSVTRTCSSTPTVTPSVSKTPSLTPTVSITPTATPSISLTPSITCSPNQTPTRTPTGTPTATPTQTKTPSPTFSPSKSASPSTTPSLTPSKSLTPTLTPSVSITCSLTPSISITASTTCSPNQTPTITPSVSPTTSLSVTQTPSQTPSSSLSPSPTRTPSVTITPTRTKTPPPSPEPSSMPDLEGCTLEAVPNTFNWVSCSPSPSPTPN